MVWDRVRPRWKLMCAHSPRLVFIDSVTSHREQLAFSRQSGPHSIFPDTYRLLPKPPDVCILHFTSTISTMNQVLVHNISKLSFISANLRTGSDPLDINPERSSACPPHLHPVSIPEALHHTLRRERHLPCRTQS
jgi:hypothetical protein